MDMPFLRTPYNYDRNAASDESGLFTDLEKDPSKTVQSQKDEADINVIMRKFGQTGHLPVNIRPVVLGDFDGIFDFQTAMNAVRDAQMAFGALDADLRARFNNDPQRFVEFCSDANNLDEMRKLGLADPVKVVDNPVAPVSGASPGVNGG